MKSAKCLMAALVVSIAAGCSAPVTTTTPTSGIETPSPIVTVQPTASQGIVPLLDNSKAPLGERLGVTYWGSKYIPDYDATQSGMASAVASWNDLGTKVVKISTAYLTTAYPFDQWEEQRMEHMDDILAQKPYDLPFAQDYKTYFLVADDPKYIQWKDGISPQERSYLQEEFYRAAKYLYTRFEGTGKTFILQNWEADSMLSHSGTGDTAVQGMIDYFNAKQDGIRRAQQEFGEDAGVRVLGAVEVNKLMVSDPSKQAVELVVPHTYADIYLYSWHEYRDVYSIGRRGRDFDYHRFIKEKLLSALNLLADKAPDSAYYGAKNVAISEFGYPEIRGDITPNLVSADQWQKDIVQIAVEAGDEFGLQYMVYWEMYCNEMLKGADFADWRTIANRDMGGYWLVRPDGSKTEAYLHFKSAIAKGASH